MTKLRYLCREWYDNVVVLWKNIRLIENDKTTILNKF